MEIKVLGAGCKRCEELYVAAEQALAQAGTGGELIKEQRLEAIAAHGVFITPALVIDGKVKATGKVPAVAQIATWLKEAAG
jgi:small redox-active disulfide protein 2